MGGQWAVEDRTRYVIGIASMFIWGGELTLYSSIAVVVCMRGGLYGKKSM